MSGLSFLAISNTIHKEVFMSRPHNFHAVVFPCPITVSEHKGPFCRDQKSLKFSLMHVGGILQKVRSYLIE